MSPNIADNSECLAPNIKDNLVPGSSRESLLCNLVLRGRDPFGQRQGRAAARLRFQSLLRFRVDSKKMIPKNHRSTKIRNPETESREPNAESNINDRN